VQNEKKRYYIQLRQKHLQTCFRNIVEDCARLKDRNWSCLQMKLFSRAY